MRRELIPFGSGSSFPFFPLSRLGSAFLSDLEPFTQHLNVDLSKEEDGSYLMKLPLAGFAKEDIKVDYDERAQTLTVVADIEKENGSMHKEYSYRIRDIDPATIKAAHHEGMLELRLRTSEADETKDRISIPVE